VKDNTTFFKLVQNNDDQKGQNRVRKLPFYEGRGGLHGFQPFPARLDGIVQNQRSMVERGATTIADQDKMVSYSINCRRTSEFYNMYSKINSQ
jgi:hypothetical protein